MLDIPPNTIREILLPSEETCILDLVQYPTFPPPNGPDLNATSDTILFSIIDSLMQIPDQVSFVRSLPVTCVVTKTYFSNTLSLTESIGKLGCVKELSHVRHRHDITQLNTLSYK
jgi:hypothetical protein